MNNTPLNRVALNGTLAPVIDPVEVLTSSPFIASNDATKQNLFFAGFVGDNQVIFHI